MYVHMHPMYPTYILHMHPTYIPYLLQYKLQCIWTELICKTIAIQTLRPFWQRRYLLLELPELPALPSSYLNKKTTKSIQQKQCTLQQKQSMWFVWGSTELIPSEHVHVRTCTYIVCPYNKHTINTLCGIINHVTSSPNVELKCMRTCACML